MLKSIRHKLSHSILFLFPLIFAGVFGLGNWIFADSESIVINEVQIEGEDNDDDFIELYNIACEEIDIYKWKLIKKTRSGKEYPINTFDKGRKILSKGYFLWANSENNFNIKINADEANKASLSDDYSIALFDNRGNRIDSLRWGSEHIDPFEGGLSYNGNPEASESIERTAQGNIDLQKKPNPKNSTDQEDTSDCGETKKPEKTYSDKIYINEILPNAEEEFIELYNSAEKDEDLVDWILRDGSKTGKYVFPENSTVKATEYLAVYKKDFKFALNNSGGESVFLYDPDENLVFQVSYAGSAKKDVSYNFDGLGWRWSKYLTPGTGNKFNNLPASEINIDEKIYEDVYADFAVRVNDPDKDDIKVSWDFGDGHKSYKQKTRHKYAETGSYAGSVQIFDGSEEVKEEFMIEVTGFPEPKVRIVRIMPNPEGRDSEGEWITVKNKSKKEVDLKNWSIATGKNSKKMVNHPIFEELLIKAGKEKVITREFSKFTLNNKKARIELRYPNGEVAHRAKYKREKSVQDDEVYEKAKDSGWVWTKNAEIVKQKLIGFEEQNSETTEIEGSPQTEEGEEEFPEEIIGKQSADIDKQGQLIVAIQKKSNQFQQYLAGGKGKVLGVTITKNEKAGYFFSGDVSYLPPEHYAVKFFKIVWRKINAMANKIIADAGVYW